MGKSSRISFEWAFAVPLAILGMFAFFIAKDARFVEDYLRPLTFDTYQKIEFDVATRKNAGKAEGKDQSSKVVYLEINPDQSRGQTVWPWPRNILADLTLNLYDAGAEIVVFDMAFDEPDHQSPDVLLDNLWRHEQTKALVGPLSMLPDHDALLAAAFRQGQVVTSFYGRNPQAFGDGPSRMISNGSNSDIFSMHEDTTTNEPPFIPTPIAVFNAAATRAVQTYDTAVFNIPVIATASAGNGANTVTFDPDWVVRELPLIVKVGNTLYPTQIAETIRLAQATDQIYLETRASNDKAKLEAARIGNVGIPVSPNGGLWLNHVDTPLVTRLKASDYLTTDRKQQEAQTSSYETLPSETSQTPADDTSTQILALTESLSGPATNGSSTPAQVTALEASPETKIENVVLQSDEQEAITEETIVHANRMEDQGSANDDPSGEPKDLATTLEDNAQNNLELAKIDSTSILEPGATSSITNNDQKPISPASPDADKNAHTYPMPLNGKIVFIGAKDDPGKEQTRLQVKTAVFDDVSPTHLKATAVQQILDGAYLKRPLWAKNVEIGSLIIIGLLICILAIFAPMPTAVIGGTAILAALLGSGWYIYRQDDLLLDMTTPTLAAALSFLSCMFITLTHNQDRNVVIKSPRKKTTPSKKASSKLATHGSRRPKKRANLKAPSKIATVMVCHVKGLTELEERFTHDPAGLNNLMEDFFAKLNDHVKQQKGHVPHIVGDQIIATWNLEADDMDHQPHGCETALRFLDVLDDLNETLEEQAHLNNITFNPIRLNIGVNTGKARSRVIGSKFKGDSSIAGEAMKTANWLREHSEHYGPAIIVGEDTYQSAHGGFAMLEIDLINVDERPDPYRVFALLGNPVVKASPQFREIEKAHAAFFASYRAKQWSKAWELVQSTRKKSGAMPQLYTLYESRIQHYMKNPPSQDWNGEYVEPIK